ncbi:hypothetical protein F5148DRAFT_1289276 [Russula earlei]|uniref:Uncharacterized protein n=1 Tax=Russula earlei TaxID=71964 RepID=A0ACC0TZE7_9AGAM|nr:hypothetical protein F5148DRAFT_1289276 [Russula earlei]
MSSPPESFTDDWIIPDHPRYSEAIARWAANSERHAKAVAYVKSPSDVATVLNYAKEYKLSIVIRGGGHSPSGTSSIDDGTKLAYVGGGAIWEKVDKAAIQYGLATVGCTVNHPRLVLGGGYGFLTARRPLVTARGDILSASSEENADLLWGIRGAGCNFGVVTEFVLRLHPAMAYPIIGYPPAMIPTAISIAAKCWEMGLSEKEAMYCGHITDPAGNYVLEL